jgi:cytochrome bd-type quinol oxidase subunit 2
MPAAPPNMLVVYTIAGVIFGLLFAGLARLAVAKRSRAAAAAFAIIGSLWSLIVGFFGLVAMLLWFATDHVITRSNENILQANVLSLILAVLIVLAVAGRARELAWRFALIIAGLSVLGFVLQVLPGLDQFNGEIIGLLLPAHLGMLAAMREFRRLSPSTPEDRMASGQALKAA